MYMIAKIISAITKFLDDVFKNMRCYSKCCQVNECSCSSVEDDDISELRHEHHNHHSHEPENNDLLGCNPSEHGVRHEDELERGV